MADADDALAVDQRFFRALQEGAADHLAPLLTDDFTMVEVFGGGVVAKDDLVGAVRDGHLRFDPIEVADARARTYGTTAVVVGSTRMSGSMSGAPFSVRSRYTHVFVRTGAGWQLAAAQGTPIRADA